jgi:hypothetical protein
MEITSSEKLAENYASIAAKAKESGKSVFITYDGEGDTVLLSMTAYNALTEKNVQTQDSQKLPPHREMLRAAIDALAGGPVTYREIKQYIWNTYGEVNSESLNADIVMLSVNMKGRVHYPENTAPRKADKPDYDFLFNVGRGLVELYNPEEHGEWEIYNNNGKMDVRRID